ncbi:MAG: tetratricopeptide repeat protein [Treponema sp.]|nr:tetratricopeptide repeat protein [Treponema sp.]
MIFSDFLPQEQQSELPQDIPALIDQAEADFHNQNYDQAITGFTKAISLNSDNAAMYYLRGLVYYRMGLYDSAIADFTHALDLAPDYSEVYSPRGMAYFYKKNFIFSINDFTQAINYDSACADTYFFRGIAYECMGKVDSAVADCETAHMLDPDNTSYRNYLQELQCKKN